MDPVRIGNLIKELRIKSNLTQNEFANKYGVTYQAVRGRLPRSTRIS